MKLRRFFNNSGWVGGRGGAYLQTVGVWACGVLGPPKLEACSGGCGCRRRQDALGGPLLLRLYFKATPAQRLLCCVLARSSQTQTCCN